MPLKGGNLAALAAGEVNLAGRLDADDGGDLVDLVGLERLIAVDKRPGRLTMAAKGPLDGELAIDGKLATGALELSTNGTVNASDQSNPTAALKIKFANANLRSPRPAASGGTAELLPASGDVDASFGQGRAAPERHQGNGRGGDRRRTARHRDAAAADRLRWRPRVRHGGSDGCDQHAASAYRPRARAALPPGFGGTSRSSRSCAAPVVKSC